MSIAMFKLESFTSAMAEQGARVTYDRASLDQAFADGVTEGLARAQREDMNSLSAGLERLAKALGDDEDRRAALRQEALSSLAPVLEQILDCLVPASESPRLEAALTEQLMRLSREGSALRASISCSPAMRGMVEHCLAEAGLDEIELVASDSDRISLSLSGGRIDFSADRMANEIRELIAEIKGEDAAWTH
ncbi:MAG: hypothetical protein ABGW82_08860 [Paracoccus sp. (in: a-proteobacteria)]|uniref:hypothetical protein n=1 Tax=unclassified Paracoccus (in: a-proteobacteria) TaxID=2688777 RepID=UPI000C42CD16|nr:MULTISPECIES: hypothetical protein [unclassified Paracoccus (in: a-proteobacteria)]MAN54861.1 hypothetical protein [Paracoccus sp. (in: a-proteobacteria)]MBA47562.1 hypothetical protein [Paracoccus sp. (in: a-proteobacteria)]MCS5602858.1 hypothetical protein [Paracoccus sp. (in: a-proteobacteria)]HIC67100.1 hypothetical protein [Paracoccus sp. (in: a-proteobacteria)]